MTTADTRRERLREIAACAAIPADAPPLELLASWRWTAAVWREYPPRDAYATDAMRDLRQRSRDHVETQTAASAELEARETAAADAERKHREATERAALADDASAVDLRGVPL